jgi:hypothetical protein
VARRGDPGPRGGRPAGRSGLATVQPGDVRFAETPAFLFFAAFLVTLFTASFLLFATFFATLFTATFFATLADAGAAATGETDAQQTHTDASKDHPPLVSLVAVEHSTSNIGATASNAPARL